MTKGPYYVSEADLYENVTILYETGEFTKKLSDDLMRMCRRIVGAKRFDSCSDILREEMISSAFAHVCLRLIQRKYDFHRGSKVYSWASRVIINDCLQSILKDTRRRTKFLQYAERTYEGPMNN